MKLRLPHKFQAALLAALASVSFTTLSTGTAAYAADVVTTDMTQWVGYDEASGTAFVGSMGATNNAGTVYTGTTNYNNQPQWKNTWSYVVTVDAASLISSTNQTVFATIMSNKDDIGYSEGVKVATSGSNATVTLTSWSNAGQSQNVNVANYNDLTFVLSRDTDAALKFAVYGDGNFTQALYTAQVNGQTFSSTSMAAVTTGGLDSQYHKHNNGGNNASLLEDSAVGSYVVTGAAYTWGSKITEAQLGTYYAGISHTALTWNGTGSATTWNKSAENWLNGDAAATYDESAIAVFAAGDAGKTVTLGESLSAYELKFQESYTLNLGSSNLATTAGWDITSGKTLTLNGTGTASAWTITGGGALANNARLQLGGLGNSTIGSVISGSGSVEKVGAGTLTLTAANTFTGSLTISEGTVKVTNNTALGQINASRLIKVAAGATLDVNGNEGTGDGYTVTLSGGTLTNTGTAKENNKRQYVTHLNLTADSKVVAAQHFGLIGSNYAATSIDLGGHTLTIEGPNTYYVNNATITGGGQLKVASGTLNFNTGTNDTQKGSFASNFELAGGILTGNTLVLADSIYINTTANSTMSLPMLRGIHGITFKGAANLSVSGDLTGYGAIAKEGAGALTFTGNLDVNGTIQLATGSLNLTPGQNKAVNVRATDLTTFEVAVDGEHSYSGAAGTDYEGSGYLLTDSRKYYLVHSTGGTVTTSGTITGVTSPEMQDGSLVFSVTPTGSGTYYINRDLAYNGTEMGAATTISVAAGKTLSVGDSDLATVMSKTSGAGNVTITSGGTITGGNSAANAYTTRATGTLTLKAGQTLTLGTNKDNQYLDFSSFSNVVLENGAVINLKQHGMALNNLSVASGATAHLGKNDGNNDTLNENIDAVTLHGTTLVNGELQMGTNWKWQMSIDKLAGSGTLVARGSMENHHLIINSFDGTFGTLKYTGNNTEIRVKGSGTINNLDNTGSGNTLTLAEGVTLEVLNTAKVNSLSGAGTLVVDVTKTRSLGAATSWTGTLRLHGNKGGSIGNFIGNANSTVELTDLTGWTDSWSGTMSQNIKLTNGTTGYAWKNVANTTRTDKDYYAIFTGRISGEGTFEVQPDLLNYKFTGDVSEWTGVYKYSDDAYTSSVIFAENAKVINAQILDAGTGTSKLRLVVDNDATFNNTVTADEFELQNNHSVTFNNAATFSGNMSATGGTVNLGEHGSLSLGGLTKTGAGTLTLHGFSSIGSTIDLQAGSLVFGAGTYDLSDLAFDHSEEYSATDHGYLTIRDTVQLVSTGTGVSVEEGATFKFTTQEGPATATSVNDQGEVAFSHEDDTTYILNNNTSMDYMEEYGKNPGLATVRVQGGTGTINMVENGVLQHLDVRDGSTAVIASENDTELALSDAASFGSNAYVEVQDGAYLKLSHGGTAAAVLTHAKGAGTITLAANASLGAGSATAATGTLTIADGKTLTLGGGDSTKVNISSFTQVVLDGGTISYNADESTINGLTVKDGKSGTLHLEDMGSKALVLGGDTVVEGTLTVKNHWNSLLTISHLTGDGTLIQTNGDNAVQEMIFAINSLQGFTGAIELSHNQQGDTTSINTGSSDVHFRALTMNIGSHTMNFALDADATIGALTLTAGTANFTGAGTLTVGGLDGTAPLNVASLVISGTEAAHSYNGTASIGTLTMNGGTQTIGGTVTPTNTWVLNGGSLTLAGTYNLDSMDASSRVAGHTGGVIDGNGFEALTGIQVVQVNNEAQLTSTATFVYGGKSDYTMDAQGVVEVESSGTTYDTFYILNNADGKTETLTNAREQAGEQVDEFVNIVMNGGTSLDANAGGTLTALTVSGGTAGATTLVTDSSETPEMLTITTVTVGVGDNLTVEGKALTITSTVLNERAGMVVGDGAAVTLSGVDMGLNSTFTVTGTGRVKLTDGTSAKNLLLSATGDGTYELATNVNLGNGVSTTPTGTLVVDSGYTLTLSGNKAQETYLDSFGKIQLEGGNIASSASMGTLHNVTVTADSAINFNDFKDMSGGQHQALTTLAGTTDIAQNATLTVHTGYKSNQKYEGLSGAGTLKFTTSDGDYGGATVAIDSLQGFSGNITLAPGNNNPVNITAAIGDAPVSMGVITLANGGNITATGSNTLTVAGLDGTAGSLTVQNLTINVEGEGSHTYGGTLNVSGQLTKTGSGTQSLGTFTPAAPIVVSGGTLTFTGRVEIQQLVYTEGPRYTYTDASRTLLDQANGLRYEESKRAVYIPTGDGRVTLGENGTFTLGGQTVTVGQDGVYHSSAESADLTTLWVNTGMVNLADYASVAGLTTAKLADAGTLNLGAAAAPGSIATLQYQEGATVLHLAGTGTVNAITGDANLNLAADASVTLGYNPNIATGHTFTTAGEGALTVTTLTNTGGAISISSNLTVNGGEDGKGGTHNQQGLAITGGSGSVSILAGTTTVTGAVYTGGGSTGTTLNVGTGDADAVLVARRIELGDHNGDTSAFTIGTRGTVVVTGNEDIRTGNNPQKDTSLQLSEWNQVVTTTVLGRLFAKDATAFMSRDKGSVIHVDGGTMAVKGIATTYADNDRVHTVTIDNGGKLVMGTFGLAAEAGAWDISVGTGEIGMYDTATTVGRDITVNDTLTLNTARYEWGGATPAETTLTQGVQEGTMTVSAALSGEGGIVKNGAGTLVLAGANTYSGGTVLNAGTLQASSLGSGDVTVNAGTLQTTALGADANVTVNAGTLDLTGAPAITAGGDLTLTDGATLVLAGANMLTMGGELSLSGAVTFDLNNIIPAKDGDYVLATGSTASITEGADISVVWNTMPDYFQIGQNVHVVDGNKWVITLTALGQDLIWNGGEAEWSSTGDHWHTDSRDHVEFATGNKAIFATSEVAAIANVNGDINASGVVVESGATVTIQAAQEAETASITAAEFEVSGNLTTSVDITATEIVGRGEAATWNIGAGSTVITDILTADGGATLTLSGEGTLTAGTITGDGTIVFDRGFQPDTATITVAEGKELALRGQAQKTVATENLNLAGTLVLEDGYQMTISDQLNPGTTGVALNIRNNAHLTVSLGSADNVLNMDAASTGDLHVGSGTISYLSELGGQTVHMAAGTKLLFGLPVDESQRDDAEFTNDIVLDGNATVQVYGSSRHTSATISGDVTGTGYTLTKADGDQTLTFSGEVNVGGLTTADDGNGTIVFNGGSGSIGKIKTNNAVTIQFSNKAGEESSSYTFDTFEMAPGNNKTRWLIVDRGVTVNGTGSDLSTEHATIMNSWGVNGGGLEVNGTLTTAGVIGMDSGTNTSYIKGSGTINTTGLDLCNGNTTYIQGGITVNITSATGIYRRNTANTSAIHLVDATLQAKDVDWEFKTGGGDYTVTLDSASGTTFDAATGRTLTLSKEMGGSGKLVKTGEGIVKLSGANTYSGGTTISAGTVETTTATALGTGDVTVASTGTLLVSQNLTIKGDGTADHKGIDNQGTVSIADGKTLSLYGQVSNKQYNLGTVNVLGTTATIENTNHRGTINLGAITGATGSTVTLFSNHSSNPATWNLGTAASGSFAGDKLVLQVGDNGTGTGDREVSFNFNNEAMFSGKSVQLQNATVSKSKTMTNNVVLNAATVKVGGIRDAAEGTVASNRVWSISKGDAAGERATLVLDGNDANGYSSAVKVGANIDIKKTGSATQSFGGVNGFNGSVDVEAGVLNIMNAASVNVTDVTIGTGATLGVYTGATTGGDNVGSISIEQGQVLTVGDEAKLNANLTMKENSVMDVSAAQDSHGLNLGCSLTIEPGATLSDKDMTAISGLSLDGNRWYYISTSVEQLHITGIGDWDATQGQQLTCEDYRHVDLDASEVYKNLESQKYAMVYNWSNGGENVGTYTLAIYLIPEPTTGTLSLLALCALAARRRRK